MPVLVCHRTVETAYLVENHLFQHIFPLAFKLWNTGIQPRQHYRLNTADKTKKQAQTSQSAKAATIRQNAKNRKDNNLLPLQKNHTKKPAPPFKKQQKQNRLDFVDLHFQAAWCISAAWKRGNPSEDGTQAVLHQKYNRETALGACPQIIAPASGIRPDWKDTSGCRLWTDANALPVCTALCFGRSDAACNRWYAFTEATLLRTVAACTKLLKIRCCLTERNITLS